MAPRKHVESALSPAVITRIRRYMDERQMNQSEVVRRAFDLGHPIGKATLNRILNSNANARYQTLDAIAKALGVDVRALTEESSNPQSIPEPMRWGAVLFVPVARYYDGAFHLDPSGAQVPTPDLPSGSRYITFSLEDDAGMYPEISIGDRLFVDVTPMLIRDGEIVMIPYQGQADELPSRVRIGRASRTGTRVNVHDNTGGVSSLRATEVLGVIRRVCRENLVQPVVQLGKPDMEPMAEPTPKRATARVGAG